MDEILGQAWVALQNEIEDSILNVGSGDEVSIKSIAENIKQVIQYKGVLSFDTSKPDGNPRKLLNSSKMLNYGWKSEIQLFEGLESTYKWFQENIKIN